MIPMQIEILCVWYWTHAHHVIARNTFTEVFLVQRCPSWRSGCDSRIYQLQPCKITPEKAACTCCLAYPVMTRISIIWADRWHFALIQNMLVHVEKHFFAALCTLPFLDFFPSLATSLQEYFLDPPTACCGSDVACKLKMILNAIRKMFFFG